MFPATPDSPLMQGLGRRGAPGKGMTRAASLPELELEDAIQAAMQSVAGDDGGGGDGDDDGGAGGAGGAGAGLQQPLLGRGNVQERADV